MWPSSIPFSSGLTFQALIRRLGSRQQQFPESRSDNDRRSKFDLLGTLEPSDLFRFGVALQAYAGKPVNVTTGRDFNGDGLFIDRLDGCLAARGTLYGPGRLNLGVNLAHDFHFQKEKKNGRVLITS